MPAQNLVEYGLLVAVVMLAFIIGLSALMGAEGGYLTTIETKPDPTVIAGLPNHAVQVVGNCSPLTTPAYTGTMFGCSLTIFDLYTAGPAVPPMGSVTFSGSTVSGNVSACTLRQASPSSSFCSFTYTPIATQWQDMQATYVPSTNHQPGKFWQLPANSIYALDKTHIDASSFCTTSPVALAEPALCSVSVMDEFTNQLLPGVMVTLTASGPAGGITFSDPGQLPAGLTSPLDCQTASTGLCEVLFRSAATAQAPGAYALTPTFARDADHEASPPFAPMPVRVIGPSVHTASVVATCPNGSISRTFPLRIDLSDSTTCTLTVTDTNPPVTDSQGHSNPTNVPPSGIVTWSAPPNNGSVGQFTPASGTCPLTQFTSTASNCNVVYTPTLLDSPDGSDLANTHHIHADYAGQAGVYTPTLSPNLVPAVDVYVRDEHLVQVVVQCSNGTDPASPLHISQANTTQCTVTVTDSAPNAVGPSGIVTWGVAANVGNPGGLSQASCTLQPGSSGQSQCVPPSTVYMPATVGPSDGPGGTNKQTVTATYSGDWLHPDMGDLVGGRLVYVKLT